MVAFVIDKRAKFFYYLLSYFGGMSLANCLKIYYAEPRPFIVDTSIIPYECDTCFGNPSGHSTAAPLFGYILILDILHGKEETP